MKGESAKLGTDALYVQVSETLILQPQKTFEGSKSKEIKKKR